jgi:Tn3 transposase DDE domain
VAREVGRVIRTIFLMDWVSNLPLRRSVTETTNKIESYDGFAKWISFGGEGVIAENDPDEQQKRLRYNDLVAGAVILQNTVDITRILTQLEREGWTIRPGRFPQPLYNAHDQAFWRLSPESGARTGAVAGCNGPAAQRTATGRTRSTSIPDGSVNTTESLRTEYSIPIFALIPAQPVPRKN